MPDPRYRLIDFGQGRKLEDVGGRLIDRPSPAADGHSRRSSAAWASAQSIYDGNAKLWHHRTPWPAELTVACCGFRMPVRPTPYGHLGVFPEQSDNWAWLSQQTGQRHSTPPAALNLFAYTGASTIALALGGSTVTHVDSAKPNVNAARTAAAINGLAEHPIRYLVDDAAKFVSREVRRDRRYHTLVLDPPAYGHSPRGKAWRIERDLWPLLEDCRRLILPDRCRVLITGHSPQVDQRRVIEYLQSQRWVDRASRIESGRSQLKSACGRRLDAGFFVRWKAGASS